MKRLLVFAFVVGTTWAAEPFKPNLGPDLPRFTVTCGDVALLMRQQSQWTPGRIDFRGAPMTTERSAYGTVFSFRDVGFIGTAHLENEPEKLESLAFFLDDQPLATPTPELKGKSFRYERRSRIRSFDLTCVVELKGNRLHETTTIHTAEEAPLKLVYHFMHAWQPTVSAFAAGIDAAPEKVIASPLRDGDDTARKFFVSERVDWVAVFEPKSEQFAVSRLLAAPEKGAHISMIWNVPGSYRKYYLKCFDNDTVPAGFTGTWKMVTAFGSGSAETWEKSARALAGKLR